LWWSGSDLDIEYWLDRIDLRDHHNGRGPRKRLKETPLCGRKRSCWGMVVVWCDDRLVKRDCYCVQISIALIEYIHSITRFLEGTCSMYMKCNYTCRLQLNNPKQESDHRRVNHNMKCFSWDKWKGCVI
jgi:hypothetical protein